MTETDDEPRDLGESGHRLAISRLDNTDQRREAEIAAGESVMWATALDEHLGRSETGILKGLRFVRNRVVHELTGPINLDALSASFEGGTDEYWFSAMSDFRWAQIQDDTGRDGEEEYREHLEGQLVVETLEEAETHLKAR